MENCHWKYPDGRIIPILWLYSKKNPFRDFQVFWENQEKREIGLLL
jgi:hypothetical protein